MAAVDHPPVRLDRRRKATAAAAAGDAVAANAVAAVGVVAIALPRLWV